MGFTWGKGGKGGLGGGGGLNKRLVPAPKITVKRTSGWGKGGK